VPRHRGHYRPSTSFVRLDTSAWEAPALTDPSIDVPAPAPPTGIPVTYVPARNSIFLAVALGWPRPGARRRLDRGERDRLLGYPDWPAEFIEAFRGVPHRAAGAGSTVTRSPSAPR